MQVRQRGSDTPMQAGNTFSEAVATVNKPTPHTRLFGIVDSGVAKVRRQIRPTGACGATSPQVLDVRLSPVSPAVGRPLFAERLPRPISLGGGLVTPLRAMIDYAFSRFASQSRDWVCPSRSNSTVPLIVSPLTLPLNFWVNFWPLNSRVTVNATSPSL